MLRTLSHRHENPAAGKHRRSHDKTARKDAGARMPAGIFRVAVKSPDFVTRSRVVGPQPAISSAKEHLHAPVDVCGHRAGPLTVQHLRTRADSAPHHVARVPVNRDQTWGARRWDARVTFIQPVGGRDDQQITHGQHVATSGFMRKDTQAATHVQLPDDVGRSVVLEEFILIRTVVRAITEALRVETSELALGGDVVRTGSLPHTAYSSSKATETRADLARLAAPRPARGTGHPLLEMP